LAGTLMELVNMPRAELIERKINAKDLSLMADWKLLANNYFIAHEKALAGKR